MKTYTLSNILIFWINLLIIFHISLKRELAADMAMYYHGFFFYSVTFFNSRNIW